jgi:membrane protein implicated in regulation of membrane protease activity
LLPVQQRSVARQIWFDIEWRVGLFVRSESAQFIVTVALLWGGLRVAGVPSAALWALYGGIAQLIPWIGVPLIFVPLLPLALVVPWPVTFGAALVVTVVAWVIERGIEPWFGTRGIIHPIVSVLALMVLGEAAGLVGMMIALPLAATIQSVINNVLQVSITPRVLTPSATSMRVQALRTQLHDLEARLPTEPEQRRVQEGLLARTAALLDDADHTLRQHARTPERRRMTRSSTLRDRIPAIFSRDRQGR